MLQTNTLAIALAALFVLSGCGSIASSTNSLSDDRLKSEAAGSIGLSPGELALLNRRTEGTNTFYAVKARDGKEYNCVLPMFWVGGLMMSLFIQRRRVWVRASELASGATVVSVAGLARSDEADLAPEVDAVVEALNEGSGKA